jgi:uroporphyrinogen-III synthase
VSGPRRLALVSSPGALAGVLPELRRSSVRVRRLVTVRTQGRPPGEWLPALRAGGPFDGLIVTSAAGVRYGAGPFLASVGHRRRPRRLYTVGPATSAALSHLVGEDSETASGRGAREIAERLSGTPPSSLLYLHSDRAGSSLVRRLRAQGHRVTEVTVYRLAPPRALRPAERAWLLAANAVLATSPSALGNLAAGLGREGWERWRRTARLLVLGERSRAAARRLGVRSVRTLPPPAAQRFTLRLLDELRRAGP